MGEGGGGVIGRSCVMLAVADVDHLIVGEGGGDVIGGLDLSYVRGEGVGAL